MFSVFLLVEILHCLSAICSGGETAKPQAPLTDVKKGEVVLLFGTQYQEWDRVIIQETLGGGRVSVSSADYGTTYTEQLCNCRPLSEELTKIPLRALKCRLVGGSISIVLRTWAVCYKC